MQWRAQKLFESDVWVSENDYDKQISYEYCGEGTEWLKGKTAHYYSVIALIWLPSYDL